MYFLFLFDSLWISDTLICFIHVTINQERRASVIHPTKRRCCCTTNKATLYEKRLSICDAPYEKAIAAANFGATTDRALRH